MKCPKCGYYNKTDAEVCGRCHHRLVPKKSGAEKASPLRAATPKPAPPPPAGAGAATPSPPPAPPPVKKHLLVRLGMEAPPLILEVGKPFTIGRDPTCSLAVLSNRVSRVHAEIVWEGDRPTLKDKGSSNGTFVAGQRVKSHPLESGDELQVGPLACVYRFADPTNPFDAQVSGSTIADKGELLAGQIGEAGLIEVFQGLEFNQKTGTLQVFARDCDGWIAIEKGVPLAAESGDRADEEAALALLLVRSGRFIFSPELKVKDRRMKQTITALLLEWGRRADEAGGSTTTAD